MPIEFSEPKSPDREILRGLLRQDRGLNWDDDVLDSFIEWRYFSRVDSVPCMATLDGDCLAFIDSQLRNYWLGSETISVQESSEWYCKPKYRPTGLGVRVLQKMMDRPAPIISVRGTEASQKLLLKLGWNTLQPVVLFAKMINWRTKFYDGWRKLRSPSSDGTERMTLSVEPPNTDLLDKGSSSADDGLTPILNPWELDWFSNAPAVVGKYHWLVFSLNDIQVGYALVRIYEGPDYRRAQIVHFQNCMVTEESTARMLFLLLEFLKDKGVIRILARASSPSLCSAFTANGFSASTPQPVFWWAGDHAELQTDETNLSYLRGDDSIRPFSYDLAGNSDL